MNKPREDTLPQAGLKLLAAGVISSIAAGLILAGVVWAVADGGRALAACAGAGMGMLAMGLSQAVLTGTWKMSGAKSLAAGMAAYTLGVAAVILGMVWIDKDSSLSLFWTGIGVAVAAFAYIAAAALTYPKLRILLYTDAGREQNEQVRYAEAKEGVEARGAEHTDAGREQNERVRYAEAKEGVEARGAEHADAGREQNERVRYAEAKEGVEARGAEHTPQDCPDESSRTES